MKKFLLITLSIIFILYLAMCALLFTFQERFIFFPQKTDKTHAFQFAQPFEEKSFVMADGIVLNGVLFPTDSAKGLVFYLHGNAGSIDTWGYVASVYSDLKYDVFILDYRGYGKSEGSIRGKAELFADVQTVYDEMKKQYDENTITVLGYSIGSGIAAKIASVNNPNRLILQAPYYSLSDVMRHTFPVIPTFILKYKLNTHEYLKDCKMPVVIFHGDQDEVIYYGSSLKLKEEFKTGDTLITLPGQGHNEMTFTPDYKAALKNILTGS